MGYIFLTAVAPRYVTKMIPYPLRLDFIWYMSGSGLLSQHDVTSCEGLSHFLSNEPYESYVCHVFTCIQKPTQLH